MRIALIVSYYNRPDLLDLCLHSVSLQERKPERLIIVDDGSDTGCYKHFRQADIYIRQEHNGFGKQRLLNRAILESNCDYNVFIDQDCVLPPDFLKIHEQIAKRGQYVCGMYSSLDPWENEVVTRESISNGSVWEKITKRYKGEPHIWCGAGSAVWKEDALKANGFDTRFGWCGGDFNFGLRLAKLGLEWDHYSKYGRYLHLWHEKPWAEDKKDWRAGDKKTANDLARIWAEEDRARTTNGIAQQDMTAFEVIRK